MTTDTSPAPAVGIFLATITLGNPWAPTAEAVLTAMDAAAAAGCTEVGLSLPAVGALSAAGHRAAAELSRRGLGVACLEAMFQWSTSDDAARAEATQIVAVADEVGSQRVMAVEMAATFADHDLARHRLALANEIVAGAGRQLVVEFLPWSAIPDLATAWSLVAPLDGAAILLDTWHWTRQPGGPDLDLLARIPGERIGLVQLCDTHAEVARGDAEGELDVMTTDVTTADVMTADVMTTDLMTEAMTGRTDPGEGTVDFAALTTVLARTGSRAPALAEVFDPARLEADGPARRAARTIDACRSVWR